LLPVAKTMQNPIERLNEEARKRIQHLNEETWNSIHHLVQALGRQTCDENLLIEKGEHLKFSSRLDGCRGNAGVNSTETIVVLHSEES